MFEFFLTIIVVLSITFSGYSCNNTQKYKNDVSNTLGIDVLKAEMNVVEDNYGDSWLGDGDRFIEFTFNSDEDISKQLKTNDNWNSFPLTKSLYTVVYGYKTENTIYAPFLEDEDGTPYINYEIKNGYYFYLDRFDYRNSPCYGYIDGISLNFTLALYDSDKNKIYYYKYDS